MLPLPAYVWWPLEMSALGAGISLGAWLWIRILHLTPSPLSMIFEIIFTAGFAIFWLSITITFMAAAFMIGPYA